MSAKRGERPAGATNQTHGVLNFARQIGSRTRRTRIPTETITNASNVPMEQRLAASRTLKTAEKIATAAPVTIEVIHGVRKRGCTRLTKGGSRPSRAILLKHARLSKQQHENDRRQTGDRTELYQRSHPAQARMVRGHRDRVGTSSRP